jgi:hypothetical protein
VTMGPFLPIHWLRSFVLYFFIHLFCYKVFSYFIKKKLYKWMAAEAYHTQFSRGAVNTRVPEPGSSGR